MAVMPEPSDTSTDIETVQLELLRAKTPSERGTMALRLSDEVARLSKRAIRRVHPEFSEIEVGQMFVELHYGKELADALRQHQNGVVSPGG